MSVANRKVRLHKNWGEKVGNSQFQLEHLDCRIRIWHKQHESMDLSRLVSTFRLV